MKSRGDQVDRAKALLLRHLADAPWFSGVGVGKLEKGLGLVMSVRPGSRRLALRKLADLPLAVEVEVREVGTVRAR